MGEEEKKPEELKKPVEVNNEKKEESPKSDKPEEKKSEESKEASPPPPQEIILRVYMHCEACARKVRRCLKGFEGVEEVITDCKASTVVVRGEKADPIKVLERVQKKSHRQVVLISPIPQPAAAEPKKPPENETVKPQEKKEEPPKITVVLKVYMHCEACSQEIRKCIQRMKGVESADPDLKSSQVIVKGVLEPESLVDYIYKRTGKHAVIINVEPEKKEEQKASDEKKGKKETKTGGEEQNNENKEAASMAAAVPAEEPPAEEAVELDDAKLEMKRNEFYYYSPQSNFQVYPQRFVQDYYAYPPQMFSDENPNACSVM